MRRYGALLIAAGFAVMAVACTDVPAPSSKGTRAYGGEVQEIGEGTEAPKSEAGVVPDLLGVTVADSREALEDAGFKTGALETVGLFGTAEPNWLVCETDPVAGTSPPKGTKVNLIADKSC